MKSFVFGLILLLVSNISYGEVMSNLYSFSTKSLEGKDLSLDQFKGKVVLVVNVASRCGFTSQYKQLEEIYKKYQSKGFVILGIPSNDFASQEPGNEEEIKTFCSTTYGVTFPMTKKLKVVGEEKDPIYKFLTTAGDSDTQGEIRWNFEKFLIDKAGDVKARFSSRVKPDDDSIVESIEFLLIEK